MIGIIIVSLKNNIFLLLISIIFYKMSWKNKKFVATPTEVRECKKKSECTKLLTERDVKRDKCGKKNTEKENKKCLEGVMGEYGRKRRSYNAKMRSTQTTKTAAERRNAKNEYAEKLRKQQKAKREELKAKQKAKKLAKKNNNKKYHPVYGLLRY